MCVKRSVADIFIDEEAEVILHTVANESDKVPVLCTTENLNLCTKLFVTLGACEVMLLHSHELAVLQLAFVYRSIATLRQVIVLAEIIGGLLQLLEGEFLHLAKSWRHLTTQGAQGWSSRAMLLAGHCSNTG